jgi:hypothetical protein
MKFSNLVLFTFIISIVASISITLLGFSLIEGVDNVIVILLANSFAITTVSMMFSIVGFKAGWPVTGALTLILFGFNAEPIFIVLAFAATVAQGAIFENKLQF